MSFEMKVGKAYPLALDKVTNGVTEFPLVSIVGRKSDKKLKMLFVADNGLEYSPDGHVIGFQEHIYDLQARKSSLK